MEVENLCLCLIVTNITARRKWIFRRPELLCFFEKVHENHFSKSQSHAAQKKSYKTKGQKRGKRNTSPKRRRRNPLKVNLYSLRMTSENSPGIRGSFMTGKQLTMHENGVIIVEKPERFDFKLLKTSGWIVAVIQRCISWASIKRKLKRKLTYSTTQK